jgi:hypothetical protein
MYRAHLVPGASLQTHPSTAFNFGTGDFTIMAMVESTQGGGLLALPYTGSAGIQLGVNPDSSVTFRIYGEYVPGFTAPAAEVVTGPTGILDGSCHTVAGIRAAGTLSVMIDGVAVPVTSHNDGEGPVPITGNVSLTIGNRWPGDVMNVSVWNAALSGDLLVKAAFARITGDEPNLQGYWTLDGHTQDLSPNANVLYSGFGAVTFRYCLDCVWAQAGNAYMFCSIVNTAGPPSWGMVTLSREVPVPTGAPALCMSIMADQDTPAFPADAQVTLSDPSGVVYNQDQNTDSVFAALSGGQLWALMVVNPAAGSWRVSVTAPSATAFRLNVQTAPSAEVVQTCSQALQPLARRDEAAGTWIARALAAVVGVIVRWLLLPVGVAATSPPALFATVAAYGAANLVYQAINSTSLPAATETVSSAASFSSAPPVPLGIQFTFQINPQTGGPVQSFTDTDPTPPSPYRRFIAAIRGYFNQPNIPSITVRFNIATDWGPWIELRMSDFYLRTFNADQTSNGDLTVGEWQMYNSELETYPEQAFITGGRSVIRINYASIVTAAGRAGALAADNELALAAANADWSMIVTFAFTISEAARFQVVEYAVDAALQTGRGVGEGLISILEWSFFRALITNWSGISETAFSRPRQPGIPVNISMDFINRAGAWAGTDPLPPAWRDYFNLAILARLRRSGYPV